MVFVTVSSMNWRSCSQLKIFEKLFRLARKHCFDHNKSLYWWTQLQYTLLHIWREMFLCCCVYCIRSLTSGFLNSFGLFGKRYFQQCFWIQRLWVSSEESLTFDISLMYEKRFRKQACVDHYCTILFTVALNFNTGSLLQLWFFGKGAIRGVFP